MARITEDAKGMGGDKKVFVIMYAMQATIKIVNNENASNSLLSVEIKLSLREPLWGIK
jgi:hypothetical protein